MIKWMWNNWWNDNWQEKSKYLEKDSPSTTLLTIDSIWPDLLSYPGRRRSEKPETNRLNYGIAPERWATFIVWRIIYMGFMGWLYSRFRWTRCYYKGPSTLLVLVFVWLAMLASNVDGITSHETSNTRRTSHWFVRLRLLSVHQRGSRQAARVMWTMTSLDQSIIHHLRFWGSFLRLLSCSWPDRRITRKLAALTKTSSVLNFSFKNYSQ
jgi:hypothetical protein